MPELAGTLADKLHNSLLEYNYVLLDYINLIDRSFSDRRNQYMVFHPTPYRRENTGCICDVSQTWASSSFNP